MRFVLARLFTVLALWFCFIDLFLGKPSRQWFWTLVLIAAWLALVGLFAIAVRAYIGPKSREGN